MRSTILGSVALLVAAAPGCEQRGPEGERASGAAATSAAPSPAGSHSASAGSPATGARPEAPPSPWTGTWSGSYRVAKASPTLDPTVVVRGWKSDDGTRASGEGTLRITIGPEGVTGEIVGPLGPGDVAGIVEGERLLARIVPRDDGEAAFAGTIEGKLEGERLALRIRASDGAALTVRSGEATLRR